MRARARAARTKRAWRRGAGLSRGVRAQVQRVLQRVRGIQRQQRVTSCAVYICACARAAQSAKKERSGRKRRQQKAGGCQPKHVAAAQQRAGKSSVLPRMPARARIQRARVCLFHGGSARAAGARRGAAAGHINHSENHPSRLNRLSEVEPRPHTCLRVDLPCLGSVFLQSSG